VLLGLKPAKLNWTKRPECTTDRIFETKIQNSFLGEGHRPASDTHHPSRRLQCLDPLAWHSTLAPPVY